MRPVIGPARWMLAAAGLVLAGWSPARAQAPAPSPSRAWLVGVAAAGEGGGLRELGVRAGLEAAAGGNGRLAVGVEGWAGSGDCVTRAPASDPTSGCPSATGWAVRAAAGVAFGKGSVAVFVLPGGGVARSDGTRLMGEVSAGVDLESRRRVGLRIEGRYARLFGSVRSNRWAVGAGVRLGLGRPRSPVGLE